MNLRRKVLLSQLPLVLAVAVIAAGALFIASKLGRAPGDILYENFRSFDAAHGMLQAIDDVNQAVLSAQLDDAPPEVTALNEPLSRFERELRLQETNITEEGEAEATLALRRQFDLFREGVPDASDRGHFAAHRQRATDLRRAVERILYLNRDAMRMKAEAAQRSANQMAAGLVAMAIAGFLVAAVTSGAWIRRIMRPLRVLDLAVQRLIAGDFDARVRVEGKDEIAALSSAFNEMAGHLSEYRASSLGELLEAHDRLDSVMDSLSDAVVVYGLDGGLVTHNEVATRLLGAGAMELSALPSGLHDVVQRTFDAVRRSGEPSEPPSIDAAVEVPGASTPRMILVGATPVRGRGDTLTGVTVVFRDVTRARRIEGFKGDLVASAAHEFKTPLTSLHLAVYLCLEGAAGPLTDRQMDLLTAARSDCERLQTVVEELLEMARLESGAARLLLAEVNVAELVREAVARHETQARQEGVRLEAVPGDSLLCLRGDHIRLMHVLDNLLENALLHARSQGQVVIGFERRAEAVRVYVDDAGPGIPVELRARVFEKFFRAPGTTARGTGLGLSIVQDVVRAHGGQVGVEGSPLGGARFWFSIPHQERPSLT